jgi:AmiR/NasT family two-component response regulator
MSVHEGSMDEQFAAQVGPAEIERLEREIAELKRALASRDVIGMAKGVLIAQSHLTPDDAFAVLVRASQRENVKVREVAERIVSGEVSRPVIASVARRRPTGA